MRDTMHALRMWLLRNEGCWIYCLGAGIFLAIPVSLGHLGIGWDALNHHFYLGWTAEHPRFEQDFVAANYQAYQYPYLYWPIYKLAVSGASGMVAGVVLAAFNTLAIPPVWMMARDCIPGGDRFAVTMRVLAVALAFATGAVLSLFDSTSNDLLAGIPLLWAYAVSLRCVADPRRDALRWAGVSGFLAGISIAFKLSNGPVAVVLPVLWFWPAGTIRGRALRTIVAGICLLAGYALFYAHWGWELWTHFGNPIYPLYDHWFSGLRDLAGWHR